MTEQKREAELPVADIPLIADLQRHVDEIGHTEIGQDISAAIDVIRSLAATPAGEIIRGEEGQFAKIIAARKACIDATAAYNARLEVVRTERERGNWLNTDPEYRASVKAQKDFWKITQELADAALSDKEGGNNG